MSNQSRDFAERVIVLANGNHLHTLNFHVTIANKTNTESI